MVLKNTHLNNGFTDLSYLGLLSLSGNGAKQLLQGQVTCDMEEINANQTRLGAQCNPQGRMISLFRAFYFNNQYILQMPLTLLPIAEAAIKKFAVFYKDVIIQNQTDTLKQVGFLGSSGLNNLFPTLPVNKDDAVIHNDLLIVKTTDEADYYQILGKFNHIEALLKQLDLKTLPYEAWKQQELAGGVVNLYPETSGLFLPHEIQLPKLKGVSFKKGCYTGQEIIARMEYRGKLKKKWAHMQIETVALPIRGQDIYSNKNSVGNLVDYCQVGYNTYELRAIVPENELQNTLSLDPEQNNILTLISAA